MLQRAAALDVQIGDLVAAYAAAHEPLERLNNLAIELLEPMLPDSDVSRVVSKRFEAGATLNFGSLRDRLDAVLARHLSGRPTSSIEAAIADRLKAVDVRLQDALKADRRTAARAGVELETEAA